MKEDKLRITRNKKNWNRLKSYELNLKELKLTTFFCSSLIHLWQVSAVALKKANVLDLLIDLNC